jgi:dihydropteroate synthase
VSVQEELDRVVPVIEGLAARSSAWISVDTSKPEVARAALFAGAHIVNDVTGLSDPQMAPIVAHAQCGLVLMHLRHTPKDMQSHTTYDDLVGEVSHFLELRIARAVQAGVDPSRILLDPGIGFGKTVAQNYTLLRDLSAFTDLGHALLVGTSRKSLIGAVLDCPPLERTFGTAATVACAVFAGASVVRVHDVAEMVDVVRVTEALCGFEPRGSSAEGG